MLSADCFVAMAACAMKTTRIRLGTGVLIPSNRIAPVAANAFASLNKLAPGRIDFGLINVKDPMPLYIAASGPRARALTAQLWN